MASDIDIHGADRVYEMLGEIRPEAKRELRRILNGAASFSEVQMKMYAPGSVKQLMGTTDARVVDAAMMEAVAGVRPGAVEGRDRKFPAYVHSGTGLYKLGGGGSLIKPKKPRGLITFQKRGEPRRFVKWTRGQRPTPFVYMAYQMTKLYVQARTATFKLWNRRSA